MTTSHFETLKSVTCVRRDMEVVRAFLALLVGGLSGLGVYESPRGIHTILAEGQERTPVVGDYVTFYDRTCASPAPIVLSSQVQCFGGSIRSWHSYEYHKFYGEHQWTCGSALHCYAEVVATYS